MGNLKKVFIVDDDPVYQFGMKILMREVQFAEEVTYFVNGQEALDALKQVKESGGDFPEVIFLDLNMPVMDGWDFLEAFEALFNKEPMMKIFIVSSSINPADEVRANASALVNEYLVKPISEAYLKNLKSELAP